MAGVSQSGYSIPHERVEVFIDALGKNNLLSADFPPKDEDFVLISAKDRLHPSVSFWPPEEGVGTRRFDFMWIRGQEQIIEKAEALAISCGARCEYRSS